MWCVTALHALQIGLYPVPRDTLVHINVWTLHRDQRWWDEAFKPERWVGDKTGGDKSGGLAYMPFGVGPSMCIGYKLAGITSPISYAIAVCNKSLQPEELINKSLHTGVADFCALPPWLHTLTLAL